MHAGDLEAHEFASVNHKRARRRSRWLMPARDASNLPRRIAGVRGLSCGLNPSG